MIESKYGILATLITNNHKLGVSKKTDEVDYFKLIWPKIKREIQKYNDAKHKAEFLKLSEMKTGNRSFKLVSTIGVVSSFEDPSFVEIDDEIIAELELRKTQVTSSQITVIHEDIELSCLNICDENLINKVREFFGERVVITGILVPIPIQKGLKKNMLLILEINLDNNILKSLFPTQQELSETNELYLSLKTQKKNVIEFLAAKAAKSLNIQNLDDEITNRLIRYIEVTLEFQPHLA